MKTYAQDVVAAVKNEALNLESMYVTREEYLAAMQELIVYFAESRDNCLANM